MQLTQQELAEMLRLAEAQFETAAKLVDKLRAELGQTSTAPVKNSVQHDLDATLVNAVAGMHIKDAIRHIASENHGDFRPGADKAVLIAAGHIEEGRAGSNKLSKHLSEMSDMNHQRRNLWTLVEKRPSGRSIFRDGSREEAEEYEERLMNAKPEHIRSMNAKPDHIRYAENLMRSPN